MAGHSHDDHNLTEQKPVSFTVPFILAAVTILIIVLFLSLCDPKAHHAGGHDANHAMENPAHEHFKGEVNNPNEHVVSGQNTEAAHHPGNGGEGAAGSDSTASSAAAQDHGAEHH
jgi:hypothetical protein